MAKLMIVFEDVNPDLNDGKPISVTMASTRQSDCQDEPTVAEMAAHTFYDFIVTASLPEENHESL